MHGYKAALKALASRGLGLEGVVDDTSISGYLIQPDRRSYELAELAQHHLNISVSTEAAKAGQLELAFDGEDDAAAAGALVHVAAVVQALSRYFETELAERKAQDLLTTLELPVSRVLADMELAGIAIDMPRMDEQLADLAKVIDNAQELAFAAIGHEVNLGSPKQLQTVLFEELGLPKTKKIKSGYTTDAASLKNLLEKTGHEFLVQLMAHRESSKLRQMLESLKKSVADDGRIHTTYAQNVAATGRISSNNPNLQNIPIRSEEGRRVRGIFVVSEGYDCLLSADYSQIEMRIMAHLSGDAGLIQAYKDGEDLHRFVGSQHLPRAHRPGDQRDALQGQGHVLRPRLRPDLVRPLQAAGDFRRRGADPHEGLLRPVRRRPRLPPRRGGPGQDRRLHRHHRRPPPLPPGPHQHRPPAARERGAHRAELAHPGLGRGHHQARHAGRRRRAGGAGPEIAHAAAGP